MSAKTGKIAALQEHITQLLKAAHDLAQIPIFTERVKNLESEVERALASGSGMYIAVLTPSAVVGSPNVPGPHFDDVRVVVSVLANPLLSDGIAGPSLDCSTVAEVIAKTLHRVAALQGKVFLCQAIRLVPDPELVNYQVEFKTGLGIE